jgi:hypothetical protein
MVRNGGKRSHRSNFQCGTHDGLLKTVSWIYIGHGSPLERTYNMVGLSGLSCLGIASHSRWHPTGRTLIEVTLVGPAGLNVVQY